MNQPQKMEKYREAMGVTNTVLFKFTLGLAWTYLEKFIKNEVVRFYTSDKRVVTNYTFSTSFPLDESSNREYVNILQQRVTFIFEIVYHSYCLTGKINSTIKTL